MVRGKILCVDGGGTRSRARLVHAAGAVLATAENGPCNPATDHRGAAGSVAALWAACAGAAGMDPARPEEAMLAIGAAGLYIPSARAAFLAACPAFATTVPLSDGYAALIGAGGGRPCALIIVGTGVAGHRLDPDGGSVQRDAWGWVGGDRGSGAWVGREALRHALAVLDGIDPPDRLAEAVVAGLGGRKHIAEALRGIGPARLGSLAPLVLSAAAEGDKQAIRIRTRAIAYVAALARVVDPGPDQPLYLAGGLSTNYRPDLVNCLGRPVSVPAADAMTGCYLVAAGRAPTERIVDKALA